MEKKNLFEKLKDYSDMIIFNVAAVIIISFVVSTEHLFIQRINFSGVCIIGYLFLLYRNLDKNVKQRIADATKKVYDAAEEKYKERYVKLSKTLSDFPLIITDDFVIYCIEKTDTHNNFKTKWNIVGSYQSKLFSIEIERGEYETPANLISELKQLSSVDEIDELDINYEGGEEQCSKLSA